MSTYKATLEVDRLLYRLDDVRVGGATNGGTDVYTPKCSCYWQGQPSTVRETAEDRLVVHMKTAHP